MVESGHGGPGAGLDTKFWVGPSIFGPMMGHHRLFIGG